MDDNDGVMTKVLAKLAKVIVQTFPTECLSRYYIEPSKQKSASGKLVDKYKNERRYTNQARTVGNVTEQCRETALHNATARYRNLKQNNLVAAVTFSLEESDATMEGNLKCKNGKQMPNWTCCSSGGPVAIIEEC